MDQFFDILDRLVQNKPQNLILGLYNGGLYNCYNSYLGSRDFVKEKVTEFSVTCWTFGIPGFALTEKEI